MSDSQPFMPPPRRLGPSPGAGAQSRPSRGFFRDFLTFERMLTGQVIHLVYWGGLCLVGLFLFGVLGAAAGIARGGWQGLLLALPVLVGGLISAAALALLWRSFCEFYLAVFRISQDLSAIRAAADAGVRPPAL